MENNIKFIVNVTIFYNLPYIVLLYLANGGEKLRSQQKQVR